MADSSTWIGYISTTSGNQVHMTMHHGLASYLTRIDPDIETTNYIVLCSDFGALRIK